MMMMNPLSNLFAQLEAQATTPTPNPSVAEPQQGRTGLAPHTLLVRVANLLGVHRDYLLEQGFIEPCDLEEQGHADPLAIAALVRTNPRWIDKKAPAPAKAPPATPEGQGVP